MLANGPGGFGLAVTIEIAITELDQAKAEEIVQTAHAVWPNAIKGNVDVILNVTTRCLSAVAQAVSKAV